MDEINVVSLNQIKITQMTRVNAYRMFEELWDPLYIKGVTSEEPQFHLLRGLMYTQWCINFTKWWMWYNTDKIKKFNMWEEVRTTCKEVCTAEDDTAEHRCMQCVYDKWVFDGGEAPPFELDWNVGHGVGGGDFNNYEINSVRKLNQIFMHVHCLGRIVRGTRKDEGEESDASRQDWRIVFTNETPSNLEEYNAFLKNKTKEDIEKAHGTEHNDVYVMKKGQFYETDGAHPKWVEFRKGESRDSAGLLISQSQTSVVGKYGGATCECPSGAKYKVGALIADDAADKNHEVNQIRNYSQSCVSGLVLTNDTQELHSDEDQAALDHSPYGYRAVHCDVNGFFSQEAALTACEHEQNETAKKQCMRLHVQAAYHNQSHAWMYLSQDAWLEYKHYRTKGGDAMSPCMFMYQFYASHDMDWTANSHPGVVHGGLLNYFVQRDTGSLGSEYEFRMHRLDQLNDRCLRATAADLCEPVYSASGQIESHDWVSGTWHK